jgi:hypothetical protein
VNKVDLYDSSRNRHSGLNPGDRIAPYLSENNRLPISAENAHRLQARGSSAHALPARIPSSYDNIRYFFVKKYHVVN